MNNTLNWTVDLFTKTNKDWVKTYVQNENISDALISFNEASASFAKQSINLFDAAFKEVSKEVGKFPKG